MCVCVCVCKILFIVVPVLPCCLGFSLVVASGGCSLAVVCRLLIAVGCLVVEHRLSDTPASVVAAPRL